MYHSYEKTGLVIHNQPIPWNADAVQVECLARLPAGAARRREDFQLRLPSYDPVPLDNLRREDTEDRYRLFFRLPPPRRTSSAEVIWRHHRLSELNLPVIQRDEFIQSLRLQHPTLSVKLGQQTVACLAFVSSQCRGLFASAVVSCPTSLVPIIDLEFHIDLRLEGAAEGRRFPAHLSSSQLKGKQALVMVCPASFPKKTGNYVASWTIGDQVLATQRIKAISKSRFVRSLRISATRLVVQTEKGTIRLARQMPLPNGVWRIGPCFLVSSSEQGIAGLCPLCVRAHFKEGVQTPMILEQELLVTDGPAPFVPGTLNVSDVQQMTAFELIAGNRSLGHLPLTDAPVAAFNAEGGFKGLPAYEWSSAAEDQLQEKLAKLLSNSRW